MSNRLSSMYTKNKTINISELDSESDDPKISGKSNNEPINKKMYYTLVHNKTKLIITPNACNDLNKCSGKGICLNNQCLCMQGYTTEDCSYTYNQYLKQGYDVEEVLNICIFAGIASFILSLVYTIYKRDSIKEEFI